MWFTPPFSQLGLLRAPPFCCHAYLSLAGSVGLGLCKSCLCTNILSVSVLRGPFWFCSSRNFSAGHWEESQGAAGAGEENGWGGSPESPAVGGSQATGGRATEGGAGQTTERTGNWAAWALTNTWLRLFYLYLALFLKGSKVASKDTSKLSENEKSDKPGVVAKLRSERG